MVRVHQDPFSRVALLATLFFCLMIEKYLRASYQSFFADPLARRLCRLSPSFLTLLGGSLGLIAAILIALKSNWYALAFLLLSGLLDTLDGTVARLKKQTSVLGTVYDIVADRLVEGAIVMGLYLYAPESRAFFCLLMFMSILLCITSFLVVGIFSQNTSDKGFFYSPGLIERSEAFVFFILMIVLPSLFTLLSLLFAILVFLTAIIRLAQFRAYNRFS